MMGIRQIAGVVTAVGIAHGATVQAADRQAAYNAAQGAFDRGDWRTAVAGFRDVLAGATGNSRATAIIRARYAFSLSQIGEAEQARAQVDAALAVLKLGALPDNERASAYLTLGDIYRYDLDLPHAVEAYASAPGAVGTDNDGRTLYTQAILSGAVSAMTWRPDAAAALLDGLMADKATYAILDDKGRAQALSLRTRAALNQQEKSTALQYAARASAAAGTLTNRVNLVQVQVRGDAALAYAMAGNVDKTREMLAYSGAGHLPDNDWLAGADMDLPVCDDAIGPLDSAVIEFSIAPDGHTLGALPIYASKPGDMGRTFAEAVRGWRWRPDAAAKLDPFWRASIRMELRCMTRPDPVALADAFTAATGAWFAQKGLPQDFDGPDPAMPAKRDTLTGLPKIAAGLQTARGATTTAAAVQRYAMLERDLREARAPIEAEALGAYLASRVSIGNGPRGGAIPRAEVLMALLPRFTGRAGGDRAAAWLAAEAAISYETAGLFDRARPLLDGIVTLPTATLPADDPIRTVAILHRALLDRVAGQAAEGQARLEQAGLGAEQCSLLDVRPVPTSTRIGSNDFPMEAVRWNFEGYVRESFDIGADGRVANVRTVVAYPPFVFAAATEKAVARFRYLPPTLGGTALGCTGQTLGVNYRIPH